MAISSVDYEAAQRQALLASAGIDGKNYQTLNPPKALNPFK
jgi:hypothetical protein